MGSRQCTDSTDARATCSCSSSKACGPEKDPRALRLALWLVGVTMAYNAAEALVAVASGLAAGSVALVGFGLDSVIELAAAGMLLWRLRVEAQGADAEEVEQKERHVGKFVAGTFFALAAYVVFQSAWIFWTAQAPEESLVGILLAVASLVIMPAIAWGKLRAAARLQSSALRAEAKETLACSYLSFALLVGLVLNATWGWWWADPVAALLMVPWLIKEGREGWAGDGCC